MDLTGLTRDHGVKIPPTFPVSVEECSLAAGEIVGHSSVKSAARMNNAVVIFFDTTRHANQVMFYGIKVGGNTLPVYPLSSPEVRVTVSNVPPFIRDEEITKELSKYGKIVSRVKKVSSGCKSPLLKHVVSHRRQLRLIPKDRSRGLDLMFKVRVEEFDYILYATTDDFKCFNCRKMGHQSRTCPEKDNSHKGQNRTGRPTEEDRGDKQEGQEGTSGVQKRKEKGSSVAEEETTSGPQEAREEGSSEAQEVRESTGRPVETGSEVDMEGDEEQLKAPQLKRKQEGNGGSSQAKKVATKGSGGAAECGPSLKEVSESIMEDDSEPSLEEDSEPSLEEDSESSLEEDDADDSEPAEHRDGSCRSSEGYSVEKIKDYLKRSKNVRGARVEDYLSDKEKLSSSARAHMKSKDRGGLTKQEGYRLKKIVQQVNKDLNNDGGK